MYNLTDYNESALRILCEQNAKNIEDVNAFIVGAEKYIPEPMLSDVTRRDRRRLSVLREHNVHLLTSLQIVKDKETVLSN